MLSNKWAAVAIALEGAILAMGIALSINLKI